MLAQRWITGLLVGGMIAACAWELRNIRRVQRRARDLLYPGSPIEMAGVIRELRRHSDDESRALAKQLEERLKDRRVWRGISRHCS